MSLGATTHWFAGWMRNLFVLVRQYYPVLGLTLWGALACQP